MGYAVLNNNQKIKIPVIEAYMKITTADEKNLNEYNRLILKMLKDKRDLCYIEEIVKFKKIQIENELKSLEKYKLIENINVEYILSELGMNLISKIEEVENFNKRKEKVLIDKYSEAILKYNDNLKMEKGNTYRISKDKYLNINPVNSKAYFKKEYSEEFEFIDIDDIDIEINLGTEYWIEINLNTVKYFIDKEKIKGHLKNISKSCDIENEKELNEYCENNRLRNIQCIGNVYKIDIDPYDKKNNNYKEIINEIKKIYNFDKKLLSDNGVEIIDRENKEQEVKNILTATIYVDSITGAFTDSYIEEKTKKRGSVIHLNSNVDLNEDNI